VGDTATSAALLCRTRIRRQPPRVAPQQSDRQHGREYYPGREGRGRIR
jgi:hypothetical protein